MEDLHKHYDQLNPSERKFVDYAMEAIFELHKDESRAGNNPPSLAGDDRAECATDAIARWVIESKRA